MVTPFLSDGTAALIRSLKQRGFATQQALTATSIQLRRRDASGVRQDAGAPVPLISIALANREPQTGGQGLQQVMTSGQATAFDPVDVQTDDHFTWGGQVCEVDAVSPVHDGIVTFDFTILEAR